MSRVSLDQILARTDANCRAAQACVKLGYGVLGWYYDAEGNKRPSDTWRRAGATFPLTTVDEVLDWWCWAPRDYTGVMTGPESDAVVIDIDPRNGGAESLAKLEARIGSLGEPHVTTPSGGWHYHYSYTTVGGLHIAKAPLDPVEYPGIDVQAWGGFVGAPGAVTERGVYAVREPSRPFERRPIPEGLRELLPVRSGHGGGDWQPGPEVYDSSPTAWIDQLVADAASIPWGDQDEWLTKKVMWRMRQSGRSPEEMRAVGRRIIAAFVPQPGKAPWTEQHVIDKVNRAMQKPIEHPSVEIPWDFVRGLASASTNGSATAPATVTVVEPAAQTNPFGRYGDRVARAGDFALDEPDSIPAVWGDGERVLWSEGEALMIAGHQGLGKTTLAQQLVLHRAGIRSGGLLGLAVAKSEKPVLILAMDRPRQFARSLRRMVTEDQRGALNEKVIVWRGPLPFNPIHPGGLKRLAEFAQEFGAGTLVADSVKDFAPGIAKDEVGAALNSVWQEVIAREIELLLLHHERKAEQGSRRHNTLDDVYGSTWLTSGLGSVVVLEGEPGDAAIGLKHLKQPAALVGPLEVQHDHARGVSTVIEAAATVLEGLRSAGERGTTVRELAQLVYGQTSAAALRRASRELRRLAEQSLAVQEEGEVLQGAGRTPARWFATAESTWSAGNDDA